MSICTLYDQHIENIDCFVSDYLNHTPKEYKDQSDDFFSMKISFVPILQRKISLYYCASHAE